MRTLEVWCPDWPVLAAELVDGVPAHRPVVVLSANRVLACSEAARREGIRRGLRKREAQGRCPELLVVDHDPARDARAFEPVVAAVEEIAPSVTVVRPGACAVAARGPTRYFGGEERAAERIVEHVAQECGVESQVGIADGVFAAELAARAGRIVAAGETPQFLSGVDISAIDRPPLVDLLRRMGIRTLGAFAALPAGDVLARFGFDAALAHRFAAGGDEQPLAPRQPPPDLSVTQRYEDPLDRVDVAAFAGRALAESLHDRLARHGVAATRLGIEAITAHGEQLCRTWRHDGLLTTAAIAERVRWQLDGWLHHNRTGRAAGGAGPTAGIIQLRLVPEGIVAYAGLQPGLWGEAGEERDRAHRALTRVQGMLGLESVVTAVLGGGRSPAEQVRWVPWTDERRPSRPADRPWPGRLPPPAPAVVLPEPQPVAVYAEDGDLVTVTARLTVTAPLAWLVLDTRPALAHPDVGGPGSDGPGSDGPGSDGPGSDGTGPGASGPGPRGAGHLSLAGHSSHPHHPAGLRHREPGRRIGDQRHGETSRITGWAGPWPVDERWWDGEAGHRAARFQVTLADGGGALLELTNGQWRLVASYD